MDQAKAAAPNVGLDSYRRLADVFHDLLSEQLLDQLLDRIAGTLADLIPYDAITFYQADEVERLLIPVMARDEYLEEILTQTNIPFGEGITGWAVENRQPLMIDEAANHPRAITVPGTPDDENDALITIPLLARGSVKGALNIYRLGTNATFGQSEFELAKRFGDAVALALDNAETRAALEHQAQTDSLTGLFNHRYFHERIRSELTRATRAHDSVVVMIMDIDDFKRVNDVHGHSVGDQVLAGLADILRAEVRASDIACRIGGEELAVVMPSSSAEDALSFAERLKTRLAATEFESAGHVTLSIGVAQGPKHAVNPRELVACAEVAMMVAKAEGKNRGVAFEDPNVERPSGVHDPTRDVRSIAHLKMLQSLSGKLNRLNDVRQVGRAIVNELRTFIDYDTCRVYVVDGDECVPVAARGIPVRGAESLEGLGVKVGEGITGTAALLARPLLVPNSLQCEYAMEIPDTQATPESVVAVPLRFGSRCVGVVVVSMLGIDAVDGDDVRLLEVLAGHAAVALENGRLYEAQRKEAQHARALLEFAHAMSVAPSQNSIGLETVRMAARLLEAEQSLLWLEDETRGGFSVAAEWGMSEDSAAAHISSLHMDKETAAKFIGPPPQPVVVIEPAKVQELFPAPPGVTWRPLAVAPLFIAGELSGWITVRKSGTETWQFTDERLNLLGGLAQQASVAIENARLHRKQDEIVETANSLLEFSRELSIVEGVEEIFTQTVELTARIVGAPKSSVWLQDVPSGPLIAKRLWGYEQRERELSVGAEIEAAVAAKFLDRSSPFVVHPGDYMHTSGLPAGPRNSIAAVAPMCFEDGRKGCLVASGPADGVFDFPEGKLRLLAGIADQAKLAMANAGGFESLERTFVSTVEALANALEAKDEYTSSHARWITDMALEIGKELGFEPYALKNLEIGALFHDIGKIGMPTDVLLKPGPLSDAERAIIETHPVVGERILLPIERLGRVRAIVRHCHERYEGNGYPDRLAGADIPIESRIIFVCDAFHAMTTDRPYRRHLEADEACQRLRDAAGTQFDPTIVDVFLGMLASEPSREPVPSR
ncbi:MAG: diguanylate cyclase [Actinobacteria bacterium]|nr:diguanylate cyclase [Actinomycetota bacterium]